MSPQHPREIVAGNILDHPTPGSHPLSMAVHHLDAQQVVSQSPCFEAPRTRQITSNGPPYGGGGPPSWGLESKALTFPFQHCF